MVEFPPLRENCIAAASLIIFPTKHKNAVYLSLRQADSLLENDEIVYAIEIGGEAVAYPRRFMEIPHAAGKTSVAKKSS